MELPQDHHPQWSLTPSHPMEPITNHPTASDWCSGNSTLSHYAPTLHLLYHLNTFQVSLPVLPDENDQI